MKKGWYELDHPLNEELGGIYTQSWCRYCPPKVSIALFSGWREADDVKIHNRSAEFHQIVIPEDVMPR